MEQHDSLRGYKLTYEDFSKYWEYRRVVTRLGHRIDAFVSRIGAMARKTLTKE